FAAGMSGGIAYVLDESGEFPAHVNMEMVDLEPLDDVEEQLLVRDFVTRHLEYTGSKRAKHVLDNWDALVEKFVKVMPTDYKRALAELSSEQEVTAS
ncbi:MAG: hypothetical protein KDA63_12805, partial [Planctomycetales bacterium]|nr:hypothetical protein [Planctomycetales bacterium]